MNIEKLMEAIKGLGDEVARKAVFDRLILTKSLAEVSTQYAISKDTIRRYEAECFRAYNRLIGKSGERIAA